MRTICSSFFILDILLLVNNIHTCSKFGLIFSRAVFCCLTWNSLGTEVSCVQHVDDAWTTCGWHADDMQTTWQWEFVGDLGWQMTYVIRTSSACHLQVGTSSACHLHMHTSSTHHLPVICTATHGQHGPELSFTVTGICYWMEFVIKNVELFHFRIM